jgi:tetratricopeptide (TPR) repeat protein
VAAVLLASGVALHANEEPWTKVATPHFTILTPAGEATARAWAVELEQFRRALHAVVPVPVHKLRPVTVVLFKTHKAMQPFLPLENGRPAAMGGFFVRADEINTMMLSLDAGEEETRHTIFHEAVHWYFSAVEGPMPLWLGEGLAELYATFELTDAKTYTFGNPINSYLALLRREPFMPLTRLFGTGRESLLYNEGTKASIFYAQSWAVVHYLFHGEGSPGREVIGRYLTLLGTAASPDEAFEQAFGGTYGEIEKKLRRYIERGRYRAYRYPRATDDIARLLSVARASPADLELARGSLLLGARNPEAAEPHLLAAAAHAPKDPRPWELLGNIALARRDFDAALSTLSKAAAAGSTNYLVYHNLGVAHFPPSLVPGLRFYSHDPVEMDKAAANFRRAIALAPAHVNSYEGLAGLISAMQTFDPGDFALLRRGAKLAPDNPVIETGLAAAEIRSGNVADGRARLERLLAGREDSGGRGIEFARKVLSNERLKADLQEVDQLAKQRRYVDALAVIESALQREPEGAQRDVLERTQRSLQNYRTIALAVERANAADFAGARDALNGLLAEEPEARVKADAERLLREIERHEAKQREWNARPRSR